MAGTPDFLEFSEWDENWLETNTGQWPFYPLGQEPSSEQRKIIQRNVDLVLDFDAWNEKVERFDSALAYYTDEKTRTAVRRRFAIHFDQYNFGKIAGSKELLNRKFPCPVYFEGTDFRGGEVSFVGAHFDGGFVSFLGANFGDDHVSFHSSTFADGPVIFFETNFGEGDVSFSEASFGGGFITFDESSFGKGKVSFERAVFGKCYLQFAPQKTLGTTLSFKDCEIEGNIDFSARFPASAQFNRLSVAGTASFSECVFSEPPDFRGAKFDRPPEVARMEVPKPSLKRSGLFRIASDPDDVAKFRKLKAMAIAANDHERDGYFFAREMMAKRGVETIGFWPLLLDSAYALFSDYGRSIARPIYGFIASFVLFTALYSGLLVDRIGMGLRLVFSLEYSWHNTLPFLNTLFRFALRSADYSSGFELRLKQVQETIGLDFDWFVLASVIQQIFGGVLLFLLLLGLRNRFRLK